MKEVQKTLLGQGSKRFLFWFMRQAGRYLPEYRALRASAGSFMDLCLNPELACEISLQPIRRFDCDAIILFSDILMVPYGLGQDVTFIEGEGPKLGKEIPSLYVDWRAFEEKLNPIFRTIELLGSSSFNHKTIFGFSGAPWTLMAYMIEGGSSRSFEKALAMGISGHPAFYTLQAILIEAVTRYCCHQIDAGADAIQLFDTWAGLVPDPLIDSWIIEPTRAIVAAIKSYAPGVPIIGFPKGLGVNMVDFVQKTGLDGLSLDSTVPLAWASKNLSGRVITQGNLDPMTLLVGGEQLDHSLERILKHADCQRHIINLGHGILPATPVAHVDRIVERIRNFS